MSCTRFVPKAMTIECCSLPCCSELVMVEAAGVEPASESTPSQESTCVAALEFSRLTSKSDRNRQALAPKSLAPARRDRRRGPASFYDIQSRPGDRVEVDVAT